MCICSLDMKFLLQIFVGDLCALWLTWQKSKLFSNKNFYCALRLKRVLQRQHKWGALLDKARRMLRESNSHLLMFPTQCRTTQLLLLGTTMSGAAWPFCSMAQDTVWTESSSKASTIWFEKISYASCTD